ncbi:hypothetical protein [Agrobacterium vitis]|nr:hypothetical protein [Agrobacterium vitis]WEO75586.1 hypothetical protein G6L01_027560 [Agrobacterium vitis]
MVPKRLCQRRAGGEFNDWSRGMSWSIRFGQATPTQTSIDLV